MFGFVFAESRRRISVEQAADMVRAVPDHIGTVGVFVNPTMAELEQVLDAVPLHFLQLHGEEPPAFCADVARRFSVRVIKGLPVTNLADLDSQLTRYAGVVDGFLLDAYDPKRRGGTGMRFSWELIPAIQRRLGNTPYWIAGGLTPENVDELVRTYRPYGVDVSSGVETDGKKDVRKIVQFVEKVKQYDSRRNGE